jgi:hypothetical protein
MTSTRKLEDVIAKEAHLVRRELRSPPSAAIAGIVYALLMSTSMVLLSRVALLDAVELDADMLRQWPQSASLALGLVPFAGIAFLWFTGVIRDSLGTLEDRLLSTIGCQSSPSSLRWGSFFRQQHTTGPVHLPRLGLFGECVHPSAESSAYPSPESQ